jgi:hypothetical protein
MMPPPCAEAARPAPLGPGEASDVTDAVHLDLSTTELREAAGTLARLLRGAGTWAEGGGPVRVQHRGRVPSEALRDAIACLQCLLKNPTTSALRPKVAFECRQAVHPLERHGALWTAAAFAEAACLLEPREPWYVVEVARLAVAGVLNLSRRKPSRAAAAEAFPDIAHLRLGTGDRWNSNDPPEPWQPSHVIRTVVDDFLRAVEACPLA